MKIEGTDQELEELSDALRTLEVLAHSWAYRAGGTEGDKASWSLASDVIYSLVDKKHTASYGSRRYCKIYGLEYRADGDMELVGRLIRAS